MKNKISLLWQASRLDWLTGWLGKNGSIVFKGISLKFKIVAVNFHNPHNVEQEVDFGMSQNVLNWQGIVDDDTHCHVTSRLKFRKYALKEIEHVVS